MSRLEYKASRRTESPVSALSIIKVYHASHHILFLIRFSGKSYAHNQFVAAGDDDGTLHVLEVPRNLCKPSKGEVISHILVESKLMII